MSIRECADGTSITSVGPWDLYHSAKVMCSDGKVRATKRIAITADTFFSIPAAVKVKGKTVSGYVTFETRYGRSTDTSDDPAVAKFVRYDNGVNAELLPGGTYLPSHVPDMHYNGSFSWCRLCPWSSLDGTPHNG